MRNIISLGHDCQIAMEFKRLGYKMNNTLGDLTSSKLSTVITLLDTKFSNFFSPDYTSIVGHNAINLSSAKRIFFEDIQHHVLASFVMNDITIENPFDFYFNRFIEKKQRQIGELYQTIEHSPHIQVLRTNNNQESMETIVQLHDSIAKLRNDKPFDLYVFQDSKLMNTNWGIPSLHTFQLEHLIWKDKWIGESHVWEKVLLMIQSRSKFFII